MLIGVDFDNTIVCYDELFHRAAWESGLVPADLRRSKAAVRAHLVANGREDAWTELQGVVYGARILEAPPFEGVRRSLDRLRRQGATICIISHKTQRPYRGSGSGPDLQVAARNWLAAKGFFEGGLGLGLHDVYFEAEKQGKLARIQQLGCRYFIDDLLDILAAPEFPEGVQGLLFDPCGHAAAEASIPRFENWDAIADWFQRRELNP